MRRPLRDDDPVHVDEGPEEPGAVPKRTEQPRHAPAPKPSRGERYARRLVAEERGAAAEFLERQAFELRTAGVGADEGDRALYEYGAEVARWLAGEIELGSHRA